MALDDAPRNMGKGALVDECLIVGKRVFFRPSYCGSAFVDLANKAAAKRDRNSGGIFGPSLFLGAMLGAGIGSIAHRLLPELTANPGAYALVGMGAVFAGIIRVPLTSVFMIFELTRDYAIVVPVMIANMVSFVISRRLQSVPVYEALALQDGIHLPRPARER